MNPTTTPTATQWLAALLRAAATRLDGAQPAPPTIQQIAREQSRAAQIELLENEADAERYTYTSAMLRERIARLTRVQ